MEQCRLAADETSCCCDCWAELCWPGGASSTWCWDGWLCRVKHSKSGNSAWKNPVSPDNIDGNGFFPLPSVQWIDEVKRGVHTCQLQNWHKSTAFEFKELDDYFPSFLRRRFNTRGQQENGGCKRRHNQYTENRHRIGLLLPELTKMMVALSETNNIPRP